MHQAMHRPLPEKLDTVRFILTIAITEMLFMNKPAHSAISIAVHIAKKECSHHMNFVNAICRRISRESIAPVHDGKNPVDTIPQGFADRINASFGKNAVKTIAEAHLKECSLDITVKRHELRDHYAKILEGFILPTGTIRLSQHHNVTELSDYNAGEWWVQDAAAAIPATLLKLPKEATEAEILDICAAPGGKTMQLASLAQAGARITAIDISEKRMVKLKENLIRTNLTVEMIIHDALTWQTDTVFDYIFLDAPCSASGTVRHAPELPWIKDFSKDSRQFSQVLALQYNLLKKAWTWLKPKGTLVYCVCSLFHEEGSHTITRFLKEHTNACILPIQPHETGHQDIFITPQGTLQTRPDYWQDIGGLDGFYAARLTKKAEPE